MSSSRRERGQRFHLSLWRVALRALAYLLMIGFGLFLGFIGGAIVHTELTNQQTRWGFVGCCGAPILLVAFLLILGMAVVLGNLVLIQLRGEHLLVGARALQSVTRGGKVIINIPYENITRVKVLDVIEQRGLKQVVVRKVSFKLRDEESADTIIGFSNAFSPGKKKGEFYIEPIYTASPDEIGKSLFKRWQAFREQQDQEAQSKNESD